MIKKLFYLLLCIFLLVLIWNYVNKDLINIATKYISMTFGIEKNVTSEDRINYLEKHPNEINIAVIGDFNSIFEIDGYELKKTILKAEEDINKEGGIKGRKLILHVFDLVNDDLKNQELIEKIANDPKYLLVIGPMFSYNVKLYANYIMDKGLPFIASFAQDTDVSLLANSKNLMLIPYPSTYDEAKIFTDWMKENTPRQSHFILEYDDNCCKSISSRIDNSFRRSGLEISGRYCFSKNSNFGIIERELKRYEKLYSYKLLIMVIPYGVVKNLDYDFNSLLDSCFGHSKDMVLFFNNDCIPFEYELERDNRKAYCIDRFPSESLYYKPIAHVFEGNNYPFAITDSFYCYRSVYLVANALKQIDKYDPVAFVKYIKGNRIATPLGDVNFNNSQFEKISHIKICEYKEMKEKFNRIKQELSVK